MGQILAVYLQHGHIVLLLKPDDGGGVLRAVVRHGGDIGLVLVRRLDNVVVRQHVAVGGQDKAGAADSGGGAHSEEVGVGDLRRDADHLLAGQLVDF